MKLHDMKYYLIIFAQPMTMKSHFAVLDLYTAHYPFMMRVITGEEFVETKMTLSMKHFNFLNRTFPSFHTRPSLVKRHGRTYALL